jgi:hypothetical protein
MQVRPDLTRRRRRSTGPRALRRWLAVFAVPVALATMAVLAPTGAASAAPNITIYLTNASSFCADVKDSVNKAGTPIWLYHCSQGKSEHWYDFGSQACDMSGQYICDVFIDTRNQSLCLGVNAARSAVLVSGDSVNHPTTCEWVVDTGGENGWRNAAWGAMGDLTVRGNVQGDLLFATETSNGDCPGCWWRWTQS